MISNKYIKEIEEIKLGRCKYYCINQKPEADPAIKKGGPTKTNENEFVWNSVFVKKESSCVEFNTFISSLNLFQHQSALDLAGT